MHELSIVSSIVDSVVETMTAYSGARVLEVRLRVGALASVVEESLLFCYDLATEGTPLAASRLVITTVPVVAHCDACQTDVELASVQSFRCPRCHEPVYDLRQGRELEIESIEIEDEAEAARDNQAEASR